MDSKSRSFGEDYFGHADLGDKRRNRRMIALADQIARHPAGTLPHKLQDPADLTALYRLCKRPEVTHEALMSSATNYVLRQTDDCEGDVLILHDSTELDYTSHKSLSELGQIGQGAGRGYIAHHSLAVDPLRKEVVGLVGQILHTRETLPEGEKRAEKRGRHSRETRLWLRGTEALPNDAKLVDVCDRGADTFEFLEHESHSGRRFVIRSGYSRRIIPGHTIRRNVAPVLLQDWIDQIDPLGGSTLKVDTTKGCRRKKRHKDGRLKHPPRQSRTAQLLISAAAVRILAPMQRRGVHGGDPLSLWVVRVWEPHPPAGEDPIEWRLITNVAIESLESAKQVIDWYACRWIIEEYHKALKTGCGVESLQFHSEERLEPAIALMSVVAATLLRLRDAGRATDAKQRLATEVIGEEYIEALSLWRHRNIRHDWSVHDFVMALGRLGGHQNRKGDGPPGWLTLWRGWAELVPRVEAVRTYKNHQSRCA